MAASEPVAGAARASTADMKDVVREMSQQLGETEFLRVSLLLCKIVQNAIVLGPEQALYRSVLLRSPTLCVPGAVEFMLLSGFEHDSQGSCLILREPVPIKLLEAGKQGLQAARRRYDAVEGLEVPVRSLKVAERIGKGKFGEVYNGFWDKRAVALKTLKPKCDEQAVAEFHKEAKIMRLLNHSNVVSLLAVTLTMEPAYLVLELMRGCFLDSLHDGAAGTPGEQLESAFQVAAGMDYLHQRGVLHCDLAARNILINSDGVLKISDFGHARMVGSPECNVAAKAGKFPTRWVAPEILFEGFISKASDVWSFGITFYEFVTAGSMPYGSLTNAETKQRVGAGYRLPQPVDCPDEFHALMGKCWSKLPSGRPPFPAIVSDLAKDRQKFVSGTLHFRRTVANEDGRARSSSPGSSGSVSSVDSSNNLWTDSPLGSHGHTPPSESPSPQLRQHKEKQNRGAKLKKLAFGRSSTDLMKGESVVQVFTMLVSPLQPCVAIPLKAKHRCSELVSLALKQLGKPSGDSSQYALVELKASDGASAGGDGAARMAFLSRFIIDSERPLSIKATWPSVQTCHFVLCSAHGNDSAILSAINEHFSSDANALALHQRCRGYLLKFQESRGGTKVAGRSKSENWQRFWGVVDGNALLLYRDEVEETNGEPITYIQLQSSTTEQAVDVSKKRDVLRLLTALGDAILLRTCGKDVYRWMEAISTAATAGASSTLEKFGDGELLYTGHLLVDETPLLATTAGSALMTSSSRTGLGSSTGGGGGGIGSSRTSLGSASSGAPALRRRGASESSSLSASVGLPSVKSLPRPRRLLCALKGRQLLAFVGEARRELLDFADVVAISVLNPTSMLNWSVSRDSSSSGGGATTASDDDDDNDNDCLMTYGIQVDVRPASQPPSSSSSSSSSSRASSSSARSSATVADAATAAAAVATHRYFLKPDTPGELDSWTDAFDKLLLKLGKGDLMVPLPSAAAEQDGDRSVDVVDGPTDAPPALLLSAVGSELPEIREVPASPVVEAFVRANSTDDGGGFGGGGGVVRRSIRRRQETGFVAVAKLRKTSLYLDERSVYDSDNYVDADDINVPSSQQQPQRKTSGGAANPRASSAEDYLLSPVSESKGTSTASTPTNPELAKVLASPSNPELANPLTSPSNPELAKALASPSNPELAKGLTSPSKTEQLRALIALADKTLDKDDVLSPTNSGGSRRSGADLSPTKSPQARSPAKPSPRHRNVPVEPPASAAVTSTASGAQIQPLGNSATQEQRSDPSSGKAPRLPPAVTAKPVPSPRTMRRNREAGKTDGDPNATAASANTSVSAATVPSSTDQGTSTDSHPAPPAATSTSSAPSADAAAAVADRRGAAQSPPVRSKRPAPPPISPRPSRHYLVPPPPAAASTAIIAAVPALPDRKAPATDASPPDTGPPAGGSTKAEETNERTMDARPTQDSPAEATVGSIPAAALPGDGKPAAHERSEPVHERSEPVPPLPRDTTTPDDKPTPQTLHSSETLATLDPTTTIPLAPTSKHTDVRAAVSASPPPLPPDTGIGGSGSQAPPKPPGESEPSLPPPAIPLKNRRSKSVHSIVTTTLTAATLPRNFTRAAASGSVDHGVDEKRVLTSSASVSSDNLLSAQQQPPLPPKNPASRRGSAKQLLAASASSEHLSQSGGSFFKPSAATYALDGNLRQFPMPEANHTRQVSSPAQLHRSYATEQHAPPSPARHAHGRAAAAPGVGVANANAITVARAFSPTPTPPPSLVSTSAAEEYMDMSVGSVPLSSSSFASASVHEEYVEMSDHSLARSESLLATTVSSGGGVFSPDERRHRSPLHHTGSAHSITSSSSGGGGGAAFAASVAEEYMPMSPLDADSFMRQGHGSAAAAASRRPLLSTQSSLDSLLAAASQEYVDMADDPVGAPRTSSSAAMRPHAASVARPHASSSASSLLGTPKAKPLPRKPAYAEIPPDGDAGAAAAARNQPHPYASIPDGDSADEPPPLPSRPPGKPQQQQQQQGPAKSPSLLGRLTGAHNAARRSTQPSVASPPDVVGSGGYVGGAHHRQRTESVPGSAKAALLQGKRSVAIAPTGGGAAAAAGRSGSVAAAAGGAGGAGSSSPRQGHRQRSATVSVSSNEGGDAAAAQAPSATLGRKSKKKEKEKVLAPNWKILKDARGDLYFYENETGRTAWTHEGMLAMYEKSLLPAPPPPRGKSDNEPGSGWKSRENQDGRLFYFNKKKKLSTWSIEDTWR